MNEALIQEKRISELDNLIKTAFNTWLTDTKNMIINEGREEEFEDIMPILNKKIKLKRVFDTDDVDGFINLIDLTLYLKKRSLV